jgi:hypothetical protein
MFISTSLLPENRLSEGKKYSKIVEEFPLQSLDEKIKLQ